MSLPNQADVVVIGAGFGGIGAALTLAESGRDVLLLERLKYPGGCASTFERKGVRFEAGATVFSGFEPNQLFGRWIRDHGLSVRVTKHDPVMHIRTPDLRLSVPSDRATFVAQLCALPGAPVSGIRSFFEDLSEISETLWHVLDHPELLPPFSAEALLHHGRRAPRYLRLARWMGRPVRSVLQHHGVDTFEPLVTWLNAACQVTVQTSVEQAEAPFALAAVDFLFRGVVSLEGGIGRFAEAAVGAVRNAGGRAFLSTGVRGLERSDNGWTVQTRRGVVQANTVVANVLPHTLSEWLGRPVRPGLSQRLDEAWGAVMLYLVVADGPELPSGPQHTQVIGDPALPFVQGNHALVSLGAPQGEGDQRVRAVTISTHVPMDGDGPQPAQVHSIQAQLRERFEEAYPAATILQAHPASPRTFARFTGRHRGLVGGLPRTRGLAQYASVLEQPVSHDLYLVGDSVFPGQSALAAALGGARVAERILRAAPIRPVSRRPVAASL